jgi:hypothetical protein
MILKNRLADDSCIAETSFTDLTYQLSGLVEYLEENIVKGNLDSPRRTGTYITYDIGYTVDCRIPSNSCCDPYNIRIGIPHINSKKIKLIAASNISVDNCKKFISEYRCFLSKLERMISLKLTDLESTTL